MSWSHRYVGGAIMCLAAFLLVLMYYFAFRAGCVFDGKQGIGNVAAMEISERYSLWSLGTTLASFVIAFLGNPPLQGTPAGKPAALLSKHVSNHQ